MRSSLTEHKTTRMTDETASSSDFSLPPKLFLRYAFRLPFRTDRKDRGSGRAERDAKNALTKTSAGKSECPVILSGPCRIVGAVIGRAKKTGPEGRKTLAPGARPGIGNKVYLSPGWAKEFKIRILRPSGASSTFETYPG